MIKKSITLILFASLTVLAANRIPETDRLPQGALWTLNDSGMSNGIPDSAAMTVYTNFDNTATAEQINAAIIASPAGQVVLLTNKTFTLDDVITLKSRVVLKGHGAGQTILNFTTTSEAGLSGLVQAKGAFTDVTPAVIKSWTAGYEQGNKTLTLNNTSGLAVGYMVAADQLNDAAIGVSVTGFSSQSRANAARCQGWTAIITAINGNDVTLTHGVPSTNYASENTPELFLISAAPVTRFGIEDLSIINSIGAGEDCNIYLQGCWDYWVKGVYSEHAYRNHVRLYQSSRGEFRRNRFNLLVQFASQSYGYNVSYYSCWNLTEDNIIEQVTTPYFMWGVAEGNIAAFNLCVSNLYTVSDAWQINSMGAHGAHTMHNLLEGNYSANIEGDYINGSSSHNTIFRNRLRGNDETGNTSYTFPIVLERNNRFYTIAGNVLGIDGYHTLRRLENTTDDTHDYLSIYKFGYAGTSLSLTSYDVQVTNTVRLFGNYDYVTDGIATEEALGSDTLAASWFRTSKPSWWGDRPWPWVDPANPSQAVSTNFPAGYRYAFNEDPPEELGGSGNDDAASVQGSFSASGSFTIQ